MRRRLYFLLPDVESARRIADDLLLARVDDRHMHFLARRGTDLGELHEAGYLMKSDLLHGAGVDDGKVLMMVDVPYDAVEGIRQRILARHPEAIPAGQVRPYPVFP
jgi:hypothetical protein